MPSAIRSKAMIAPGRPKREFPLGGAVHSAEGATCVYSA